MGDWSHSFAVQAGQVSDICHGMPGSAGCGTRDSGDPGFAHRRKVIRGIHPEQRRHTLRVVAEDASANLLHNASAQDFHNRINDSLECPGCQSADLRHYEAMIGSEKLARSCITCDSE